jgi:hypothetical protein
MTIGKSPDYLSDEHHWAALGSIPIIHHNQGAFFKHDSEYLAIELFGM